MGPRPTRFDRDADEVARWFGAVMLLNVVAAMDLWRSREPWATRLLEGLLGAEKVAAVADR